jgi:predicted lipoprotein with Yx(FWY)xxD motif
MSRKHVVSLAALVAAGAAMLAACGVQQATPAVAVPAASNAADATPLNLLPGTAKSNNATPGTGDWAPAGAPASVAQKWVQLTASKAGDLDPVVVNGAHKVLYVFDKDGPNKSNCTDQCRVTWPPVEVAKGGKVIIAGVSSKDVGVIKRPDDGNLQLTLKGKPLYTFSKDVKPFDTNGEAVSNVWWAVTPDGNRNFGSHTPPGATPPATSTTAPTGAPTAALTAKSAILFDDANFSDNGASQGVAGPGCQAVPRPGVASSITTDGALKLWTGPNCTGKSVVITGDVADLASIGFDNVIQSVRFGDGGGTPTTTTSNNTTLTATSAILDSGKNLSEPNGSQAIAGHGCQNVGTPSNVSSIQADGTYKLWTGKDCTGKSVIVSGNQNDLSAIGFDKMVASIRFAD